MVRCYILLLLISTDFCSATVVIQSIIAGSYSSAGIGIALEATDASVVQTWSTRDPDAARNWISDNTGEVFWLSDPEPQSIGIVTAPFGSFTATRRNIVSSIGGGYSGTGYQSLVLGSVSEGSFVSLWELSNVPIVSSSPPQRIGEFVIQGGTTFSYRDETVLTDTLSSAFNTPEDLRLRVTLADGSEVLRTLEIATPIPEPATSLLSLVSILIWVARRNRIS